MAATAIGALLLAPFGSWGGPEPEHTSVASSSGREGQTAVSEDQAATEPATMEMRASDLGAGPAATSEASAHLEPAPPPEPTPIVQQSPTTSPPQLTAPAAPRSSPDMVGAQALALISYPWAQLGYQIVFLGPHAGVRARTLRIERRIEVFVRPGDGARAVAFDIAHEVGHAFDFTRMTAERR
ncbi:MAG: hypothetical protein ACR2H3_00370, partial [Acidimicrobiales bacterium]